MKYFLSCLFITVAISLHAQTGYHYSIDLNQVKNDQLEVNLVTPKISGKIINYRFAKIIPGTYRNSNFGLFISELKAYDNKGNLLSVNQVDTNTWAISNANRLYRISYLVEDTWDSQKKHGVYTMGGTNIEEGKNFVINTPGFFGYFDGLRNVPFEVAYKKPENFYASTSLTPFTTTSSADLFRFNSLDELYDTPIMYNVPDTTTLKIGGADILISVYSPHKKMRATVVAQALSQTLKSSAKYLGGALPVKHYAFIMYFNGEQPGSIAQGALEHNYSSFYTLPELTPQQIMKPVLDVAAHEFFHVLTPLNFSSKEVKEFDFEKPVLSKHLWLYEGTTEYASDHVQVKYGLNSIEEFFGKLSEKISNTKKYNDTLPFTLLSKFSATTYEDQYNNVYEKGALIAACFDLELLRLSDGAYSLQQLKHDLGVMYGKDKYFEDDSLFDVITKMTYPEVRTFFSQYVEGNQPLPYAKFFESAGVKYYPEKKSTEITLGGFSAGVTPDGNVVIADLSKLTDFGKKLGLHVGDQILAIQGIKINAQNVGQVIGQIKSKLTDGDILKLSVMRTGSPDPIEISEKVFPVAITRKDFIELSNNVSESQARIRNAWLSTPERPIGGTAAIADVQDINAVISALYQVLSGPAGPRNWERFRSLFYPGSQMSASHILPNGQPVYSSMSFEEYIQLNSSFMERTAFYEEEIGRKLYQYGNIAMAQSAYQFRFSENGKVEQRGINHISMTRDKGRWYISNITWQDESPENLIPQDLLK
ncbi:MAG: peptidase domain protein [Chitinophagaceae bacterium]|nr:peptidase domain protein [Chitinophagaceae bacterium]